MAINIKFLEHFEEFLRQGNYTESDQLSKLSNTVVITHYK